MEDFEWLYSILKGLVIGVPIFLSVFLLLYKKRKRDTKQDESEFSEKSYILKIPVQYRIVPLLLIGLYFFIVIIVLVQKEDISYIIGGGVLIALPGLIMFICWSLWKVEVRRDEFVYRNFIGRTKKYKYAELEYDIANSGLKWYFYKDGKKVFCMPYYIEDGNKLERVYKRYKRKHRDEDKEAEKILK